jgi:hypothetical protein
MIRERRCSESIAVGSLSFIEKVRSELGAGGFGGNIISIAEGHELRESQVSYHDLFGYGKACLSHKKSLPWRIYGEIPT